MLIKQKIKQFLPVHKASISIEYRSCRTSAASSIIFVTILLANALRYFKRNTYNNVFAKHNYIFLNFLFTDNNDTSEFNLWQSTGNSQIKINDNKKNI
ncbi:MAG: hypothetical protein U9R12_04300 [Candidatus Caldatribacteriota bacterium]|nr:hypothetical protein [Candidatus Caldatribacteriota bacterium]